MNQPTLAESIKSAFKSGDLDECERLCRAAIRQDISYLLGFYYLGLVAMQRGDLSDALPLFFYCQEECSADASVEKALYLFYLGRVFVRMELFQQARRYLDRSYACFPNDECRVLIERLPASDKEISKQQRIQAQQLDQQADQLFRAGQRSDALGLLKQALQINPLDVNYFFRLGVFRQLLGRPEEAVACFRLVLAVQDTHIRAWNSLVATLANLRSATSMLSTWLTRLETLVGRNCHTVSCWSTLYSTEGSFEKRLDIVKQGLAMGCAGNGFFLHYVSACYALGEMDQFHAFTRQFSAEQIAGMGLESAANYLFGSLFFGGDSPEDAFARHRDISGFLEKNFNTKPLVLQVDKTKGRKLRVGFVSADFHSHPVANFVLPLWLEIDRSQFEVFAYHTHQKSDDVTVEMQGLASVWRDVFGLNTQELADLIVTDQVDILVDTNGYSNGAPEMPLYFMRPAPVQVAWMGYPHTAGSACLDYRVTDHFADPVGMTEHISSEKPWRLPDGYFCYSQFQRVVRALEQDAPVLRESSATFTFACLNRYAKVSDGVVRLWARILSAAPQARLLLSVGGGNEEDQVLSEQRVRNRFAAFGIDGSRLLFSPQVGRLDYLRMYRQVDVALDTFPFNGGTTTCDALWMGVPVVALAGGHFTSRMGVSILTQAGFPELVVESGDDYVALALRLFNDREWLQQLHQEIPQAFRTSPMMDAPRFARNMEAAFQGMWQESVLSLGHDVYV